MSQQDVPVEVSVDDTDNDTDNEREHVAPVVLVERERTKQAKLALRRSEVTAVTIRLAVLYVCLSGVVLVMTLLFRDNIEFIKWMGGGTLVAAVLGTLLILRDGEI
jgi:hypothetical protein